MQDVMDVARHFAWLAALAFLIGFLSYLALGQPSQSWAFKPPTASAVSAPAADAWNLPKEI